MICDSDENMSICTSFHHFDSSIGLVERYDFPASSGLSLSFSMQIVLIVSHIEAEDAAHHQKHPKRHDPDHHQIEKYPIVRIHTESLFHVDPILS